jgi:hypothetical protein
LQSHTNGDNLNNVRHDSCRTFKNREREFPKEKTNELETNSENKNIRDLHIGINEFEKDYQPRTNIVKDENDLLADFHNILNRWKNYFCQLLNVHGIK